VNVFFSMSRRGVECKVYVGDLPRDATEKEIERAFTYYGPLK
jgi:arginine/serine-rich splicing factor 7